MENLKMANKRIVNRKMAKWGDWKYAKFKIENGKK